MKNKISKFSISLVKILLPILFKILIKLKLNRRVINFLHEKSYDSNSKYNFTSLLEKFLEKNKIIALDVGAQGGFNSDAFFPKKYDHFFEEILIEPIDFEAKKIRDKKFVINKGLWSEKVKKKLYILDNRLGSSSMYEPNENSFDLHDIREKKYGDYKVTRSIDVECNTLANQLAELNINNLDYLKIDTQGSELEILKGLGKFRPLLIKIEAHFFSMYKNVPSWNKLTNLLYELNYVLIDWKGIGNHATRIPAEADLIFIPNFDNKVGKEIIMQNKNKFISLMLIFGQLKLLQIIIKRFGINDEELAKIEDEYFN